MDTFVCNDGKILSASKHCDNYPECSDGEDEKDCPVEEDLDETTGKVI